MSLSPGFVPQLQGVVVSTTTGNTSPPADNFGWENVGILGASTGVYVGNGWVLTANHVGAGNVSFPSLGKTFAADLTSVVHLKNPETLSLSPTADLVLFHLTEVPSLPDLIISPSSRMVGDTVIMVGNGQDRATDLTTWNAVPNPSGGPNEKLYVEDPTGNGEFKGYNTLGTRSLRWGTNRIVDADPNSTAITQNVTSSDGDYVALATRFDQGVEGTEFEAQGVLHDSGGGVFYRGSQGWELSGLILAVDGYVSQPVATQPMFGNLTLIADLSAYHDQIASVVPEPSALPLFALGWGTCLFHTRRRR